jgi:carboxymethylenebutenolidase
MYEGMLAETVGIKGHGGDSIVAYLARPLGAGPYPGVLVVHHMPGWDEASKAITRRFASHGYAAIMPHLHYREAPSATPDDAAAAVRAKGGVPDERFLGDAAGAIEYLRSQPNSTGKVGAIGFCSGGRQVFLAACTLDLDAAVDCYGGLVAEEPPPNFPSKARPVIDRAKDMRCPLLGLFGADDQHPAPDEVGRTDEVLTQLNKTHEFHTYQGAGHGFFATDRPMYRVEAANQGWQKVVEWFGRYLKG